MNNIILISVSLIAFSLVGLAQAKKIDSLYTDLSAKTCKPLKVDSADGILYRGECRGVGGYKLILLGSEHHQLLNLITPTGEEIELDLARKLGVAPSSLDNKIEWRVSREGKKLNPFALIVGVNIFDDPENGEKAKSFLVIVKITGENACVTALVAPTIRNQNLKARELADSPVEKSCLSAAKTDEQIRLETDEFVSPEEFLKSILKTEDSLIVEAKGDYCAAK